MISAVRRGRAFGATLLACAVAGFTLASPATLWAQAGPPEPEPAPEPSPAPGGPVTAPQAPSLAPQAGSYLLGGLGNPQQANGTIGGGNATESSSHPVTGDQTDSFDLNKSGSRDTAAHGGENGPVFTSHRHAVSGLPAPDSHVVRKGDTLWAVCDHYFSNPYEWPKIWSYNPQIKNPNWIYPGDELRLRIASASGATPGQKPSDDSKMSMIDRRRKVPHDSVFLRDQGWIHDESDEVWGEVTGSASETMFLSDLNEVYLTLKSGHDAHVGQELTLFRLRDTIGVGAIVQILGTVRINAWDSKEHVARAQIVETLDTIERGAKVGPIERSFLVVAPVANEADVTAHVIASLRPNEIFGQNQVVFIDKGEAAGLAPGNRLYIKRQGDAWRHTLVTDGAGNRISTDDERPMPPMEMTPGSKAEDSKFPPEVVAELRVLTTKRDTATCLVTQATLEIDKNDVAYARKGH
jgi:hypothetical protein